MVTHDLFKRMVEKVQEKSRGLSTRGASRNEDMRRTKMSFDTALKQFESTTNYSNMNQTEDRSPSPLL